MNHLDKEKKTPNNLRETRAFSVQLEIREASEGESTKRTIGGSIKYNVSSRAMRDWSGDTFVEEIAPGAFAEYLRDNPTVALWCHRTDLILGNTKSGTLRLTDTETELRFECDLPNNTVGNDAWENIRRGDVDGVSFGFNIQPNGDRWSRIEVDGERIYKRTVVNATLPEVSMTPFAAYPDNEVSLRSLEEFRREERKAETEYQKRKMLLELELA